MPALSLAVCDDQQSAILAFAWNGGIVSSIHHLNLVLTCLEHSMNRKYQQASELFYCK
ncbi:hypothetical protein LBE40_05130 [Bartonella taylorii]|uniref:hypothetical protein n=1 Tax=Bartonella taylorii TaxID=33046 RepID=UPI00031F52D5|nr:hypothetical protein [Bartonella taylorii]USP00622.1 hypothetical protein LBE40_04700 [Bartonella taylorii]USP00689.1 hypothetical protein LBE40_05130 [Bartonella taylorii]